MDKHLKNTGVMCVICVADPNRKDGMRQVDVGNYSTDTDGAKCVIMSIDYAEKYARLIDVPVYVPKHE